MGFAVPISGPSSTATWTVGFYITVLPGSDVESAAMNIYLLSPASADTSALPATKSEWSSLAKWVCEDFLKRVPRHHFVFSILWDACLSTGESDTRRKRGRAAFRGFSSCYQLTGFQ